MKTLAAILLLIVGLESSSQSPDLRAQYDEYLRKSKSQKAWAWVTSGTGAGLFITGWVLLGERVGDEVGQIFVPSHKVQGEGAEALMITGSALMGLSIPLFIMSGKNARKAKKVYGEIELQSIKIPVNQQTASYAYPALTLRVSL